MIHKRDAKALGAVRETVGDAGAGEDDEADGERLEEAVIAPERRGLGVARPVRLENDLRDFALLQLNRVGDAPSGEPLAAFGERVLADLEADPAARLIVDLRFNTGGDLTRCWPFFRALAASPLAQAPDRVFVLVGPNTFSAGITHVVQMRTLSRSPLVGTEPGDVLKTWSEGGDVVLPHSRINMHYADKAHTYSDKPSGIKKNSSCLTWT